MPIGWISALKMVPWGEVIEATPQLVKAARGLFRSSKTAPSASDTERERALLASGDIRALAEQLQQDVRRLEQEQQSSAALIQSLAEQQAQLVQAIEALRVRTRLLLITSAALGVVAVAALGWHFV